MHGLDECNHHHYGCSREACGGGLHSMAHGYATVRVNSQSDALYCPGYSRGCAPSFDRSYFQRIASPLREYGVRSPDLSFEINALHPDYEMGGTCAMLAIFAGSKCVIQGTTCHM